MSIWEPVDELPPTAKAGTTKINTDQARLGMGIAMTMPGIWGKLDIGTNQVNRMSQFANRVNNKEGMGGQQFEACVRNNELYVRYVGEL